MNIFWPGMIIGPLLVAICLFGYIKRDALADRVGASMSWLLPKKAAERVRESRDQNVTNLMLPLFGGMAMGVAIFILSATGVMRGA
ncbi:hypothetical protein TV39_02070 [Arthrobacter sp. SPG23]|uniref:hypothetical protein n=1 Tax=Arthrobacter sp. SPG23 TaxID=1610703 RepID=UPI0005BA30E3|nr:hypothetical protein [Arthrobacter sp. SPG23]KIS28930.1 hypothetical protein TV39_02070 [Arthrobacter sp. SPG23]